MGIREAMNRHPAIGTSVGLAVFLVAIVFIISYLQANNVRRMTTQAYYTTDNGKTWFPDDINRATPFDHGGQPAVRVYVYKCGDHGKPFPVYLERYTESARNKIHRLGKMTPEQMSIAIEPIRENGLEIKSLEANDWSKWTIEKFAEIAAPRCPEGSPRDIQPVLP